MAPAGTTRVLDFDHGVDPSWQANVLRHMCLLRLHVPDPEEKFDSWLDEARDVDENYLVWAITTWRKLANMTAFDLEVLEKRVEVWRRANRQGVSPRKAP